MTYKYFMFTDKQIEKREKAWKGLFNQKPFGREAVWILGELPDHDKIEKFVPSIKNIKLSRTYVMKSGKELLKSK